MEEQPRVCCCRSPLHQMAELDAIEAKKPDRTKELLLNNEPPLDDEAFYYQETAPAVHNISNSLDQTVASLEDALQRVKDLRARALTYISHSEVIRHPMRLLPPEIMSMIFLYTTCELPITRTSLALYDSISPGWQCPWSLIGVCRRWRNIGLHLPSLWTYVRINFSLHHALWHGIKRLRLYLERSQGRGLIVRLDGSFGWAHYDLQDLLRSSTGRWVALTVLPSTARRFSGCTFDMLQKLVLSKSAAPITELDVFKEAPSLVHIINHDIRLKLLFDPPVWHRLQRFTDANLDSPVMSQLPQMSCLFKLDLDLPTWSDGLEDIVACELPNVHILVMRELQNEGVPGMIRRFFSKFTLPKLNDLGLEFCGDQLTLFPDLGASAELLTTLYIGYETEKYPENGESVISFLASTSNVESLTLWARDWPVCVVVGLTVMYDVQPILPRLRVLDIEQCRGVIKLATADQVLGMLESRVGISAPGTDGFAGTPCMLQKLVVWEHDPLVGMERYHRIREKLAGVSKS